MSFTNWFALMGPPSLPKSVVGRLQSEVDKILPEPQKKSAFTRGADRYPGNGDDLENLIFSDRLR